MTPSLRESFGVAGREHGDVRDDVRAIACGVLVDGRLERVERDPVRAVAYRVQVELEARPVERDDGVGEFVDRPVRETVLVGPVGVRLDQVGGVVLDDPVDEELDRLAAEPRMTELADLGPVALEL